MIFVLCPKIVLKDATLFIIKPKSTKI